jgi:hypothetical protein
VGVDHESLAEHGLEDVPERQEGMSFFGKGRFAEASPLFR